MNAVDATRVENLAPNSVALTTNSKGRIQIEIKIYDGDERRAAERAIAVLAYVREQLKGQLAE